MLGEGGMSAKTLDIAGLADQFENDMELLSEVVVLFQSYYPDQLSSLHEAIDNGDCDAAHNAAHALRSGLSNFHATKAVDIVDAIETAARNNDISNVEETACKLETQIIRTLDCLEEITGCPDFDSAALKLVNA